MKITNSSVYAFTKTVFEILFLLGLLTPAFTQGDVYYNKDNITTLAYADININNAIIAVDLDDGKPAIDIGRQFLPWSWDKNLIKKNGFLKAQLSWVLNEEAHKYIIENDITLAFIAENIGHRYRFSINGSSWQEYGWGEKNSSYIKTPKFHFIPSRLLLNGVNTLAIETRVEAGNLDEISPIKISGYNHIYSIFETEERFRHSILIFSIISAIVVCFLSLIIWFYNKDSFYLIAFFAELAFSLQQFLGIIQFPPIPTLAWNSIWQTLTSYYAFLLLILPLKMLEPSQFNQLLIKIYSFMIAMALPFTISTFYLLNYDFYVYFWKPLVVIFGLFGMIYFTKQAIHFKNFDFRLFTIAGWWVYVLFIRDYIVLDLNIFEKHFGQQRYANFIFLFFNISLIFLITKKQHIVEKNIIQVKKRIVNERRLVVSDIHDSVGLHFIELLSMVQNDYSKKHIQDYIETISIHMRTSLSSDNIRLVNIEKMIKIWLERVYSIFINNNITLKWNQSILPELPMTSIEAQHLEKITNELIANLVAYSKATIVTIDVTYNVVLRCVEFSMTDDGIVYDPDNLKSTGQGLRNIRQRCDIIGMEFKVEKNTTKGMKHLLIYKIVDMPNLSSN